jgi:adenylate kinase
MTTELEQVDIQIEAAQRIRTMRDSCVKLMANKHFKDVIDEGYFKEEAARLVMAKSSNLSEAQMKLIDNMQYGVGALANFLESVMRRGAEMDQAIGEHEETREEILAEEVSK